MARLLAVLAGLFAVLFLAEDYLRERQIAQRELYGSLRSLAQIDLNDVVQIGVRAVDGRTWRYVRVDSSWRYPDYYEAFAQPKRIEHVLKSLLHTPASVVSVEAGDLVHYGLMPTSPVLELVDETGTPLLTARLGRGAPDMRAGEAYIQLVNFDTIYHLHANPAHAFDSADPPMIDRRVRPRALGQKTISHIRFAGAPGFAFAPDYPVRMLVREMSAPATPNVPGAPPGGPTYVWRGVFADGERECVVGSVFAYVGFLERLSWDALRDARESAAAFSAVRSIYLADEDGRTDTLDVGAATADGQLVRYRTTGQVFSISSAKAELLFPVEKVLLDTLPQPNVYEKAEPYAPF